VQRTLALVAVIVLVAGCGGGADTESDGGGATTAAASSEDATSTVATTAPVTEGDGDGGNPSGSGDVNWAVVTIGDQRYEFDVTPGPIQRCDPDFFGAFWVVGVTTDGSGIVMMLPPPDDPNFEDPASLEINDGPNDWEWMADEGVAEEVMFADIVSEGQSQVDSYTIDGNRVSGRATFIERNALFAVVGGTGDAPEPVAGSFEAVCEEEG
jgi:hypothetical protein